MFYPKNYTVMKNKLLSGTIKILTAGMIALLLMGAMGANAQVSFTQTLNADFYKGHYNDILVESDQVHLPMQANDIGTWLTTTILPQTLEGHKSATWNNRYVYVVGGYNDVDYSNAVYRATLQSGGISSWTTLDPLPVGIRDHAVVIGTNTIYVLGGRDASNIYNTVYYAAINSDGSLGSWETSAVTLPATLWGHTAVYANGYIYVAGGANTMTATAARTTVYYAKVLADNTLSSFSTATSLPQPLNGHSMVVQNDVIYVLGGFTTGGAKRNTVYYATSTASGILGAWSATTPLPVTVSNHSSVIMNGLITVMAGESGGTLSNSVYYADVTATPFVWNLSPNVLYDRTRDGAAFAKNGQIIYCGGENLSGTPIHNGRYAPLNLSTNYKKKGYFISNPFYELGAERMITELTFIASVPAGTTVMISYRTAGEDLNWSNWTAPVSASPIVVGQTKRYLQYKVIYTSTGTNDAVFNEMNLWTPGTELAGNLNSMANFTLAQSPYWVTADISFTSGTHTFNAGVELNFLPQTGMTVGQANIICNGTVTDSVRFRGYTGDLGLWDGIYFDPSSDNGVSSQFFYTVIQNAGYGSNNANLYCNGTNEPFMMHCNLRGADGHGMRLNNSHPTVEETVFGGNIESGVYLENSNPSFLNCEMSANQFAGIHLTSAASEPNFYTVLSAGNTYAMYYPSPDFTILPPNGNNLTFSANTYDGICLEPGRVSENRTWNSIDYDYIMLGDLLIGKPNNNSRLTIEPGNTIKFLNGFKCQIGAYIPYSNYGGELYAIGTADSVITFTSHDGTTGGWEGFYFDPRSDHYSGVSVLDYCVIENGNDYNIYCSETNQPQLINSTIRNAVLDGVKLYKSYGTFENCDFYGFGRYPIYFEDWTCQPVLTNNTYSSKGINLIGHAGGHFTESRSLQNDGIGYHILNPIIIGKPNNTSRLTIEPGLVLNFEPSTYLQIGIYIPYSNYGGELYAEGSADSLITFKANNDTPGGWEGLYFEDRSDYSGATSSLLYCIVEQGNEYNLFCDKTGQPSIENCIIRNAVQYGIKELEASPQIHNSFFLNNGSYPIYYTDWTCNSHLMGNTYGGNNPNQIALSGGHYTDNRTLYNDGIDYLILSDIIIGKANNVCRLTIEPGNSMRFASGTSLQVGIYIPYSNYGGELYAEGNADSLIIFMPDSEVQGDWEGIFFDDRSDYGGATSSMKYCTIEKGNTCNVKCESTVQPVFEDCMMIDAVGDGLYCMNASPGINTTIFTGNGGNGIYLDGNSNPDIGNDAALTCNLYLNGMYNVYNNTTNNIDARYNYWGTADSAMIAQSIYDKYDNTVMGIVIFADFAQLPSMPTTTTDLSGDVWYHNTVMTPMNSAAMQVSDMFGAPIANTVTNGAGHYAFAPFASGTFTMEITPSDPFGGVNATDALIVLNHFAKIDTLYEVELSAADVNASATVNGTDALFILQRWAGAITSFPSGDWLYNSAFLLVNGNQVVNDFEMLCFGDVNSSYLPTDKGGGNVNLAYEGSQVIASFMPFTVEIHIKDMIQAGAVSFGLFYPEEYMEVEEAMLTGAEGSAVVTINQGLLRIGRAGLDPLSFNEEDIIITLQCMAKDLTGLTGPIQLALMEESEFTDIIAQPFATVNLTVPELVTLATGIGPESTGNLLKSENYPNPFTESTTITYTLPYEGHIMLKVMNLHGETLAVPVDQNQDAGEYSLEFSAEGMEAGIYFYILEFSNAGQTERLISKMSVIR